jgi:hypothetical protein
MVYLQQRKTMQLMNYTFLQDNLQNEFSIKQCLSQSCNSTAMSGLWISIFSLSSAPSQINTRHDKEMPNLP